MSKNSVKFTATDILGAIRLEASRLVVATDHYVAGATFPEASSMQAVIERISDLNGLLLGFERTVKAQEAEALANRALVVPGTGAVN
jgi:hypothetical protein